MRPARSPAGWFILGFAAFPLVVPLLLLASGPFWLPGLGRWLDQPECPVRADAIAVLGGGGPERVRRGVELYKKGFAPEIWITGERPRTQLGALSSGSIYADYAVSLGVPVSAVRFLATSSTWADGQRIAGLVAERKASRAIVVTDWYHARRALGVLRRHLAQAGCAASFSAAPCAEFQPENWWRYEDGLVNVFSEIVKSAYYWAAYGLPPWASGGGPRLPLHLAAIIWGGLAAAVSCLAVSLLIGWMERRQIMDVPNDRSSHSRPTPRGGGLAIVAVSLIGGSLYSWLVPGSFAPRHLLVLAGALLVAGVSWADDFRGVPTPVRFLFHAVAAVAAMAGTGFWRVVEIPIIGAIDLSWGGAVITGLWIVGLTNAYNFMDGIDGIAGGQALTAGLGWLALSAAGIGAPACGWMGLTFACASLGFLVHNWPPAKVFLGDVGSAFLGFSFALLAVVAAKGDPRLGFAGALLVWPFLFDSILTFLRRLIKRENVFAAHRSHLYQRLVLAGRSHGVVASLYIALGCLGVASAFAWASAPASAALGATAAPAMAAAGLWLLVLFSERKAKRLTRTA